MPGEKGKAGIVFSQTWKLSGCLASIHLSVGIFIFATLLALRYSAPQTTISSKISILPLYLQSQNIWIYIQSCIQKGKVPHLLTTASAFSWITKLVKKLWAVICCSVKQCRICYLQLIPIWARMSVLEKYLNCFKNCFNVQKLPFNLVSCSNGY